MNYDQVALNKGYLNEEFRLYHLRDNKAQDIEFHYHEFDKIVIFISGKVSYIIEGTTYFLKPWDVLFVRHGTIHQPIIGRDEIYERIVIWVNNDFLDAHSYDGDKLSSCFEPAKRGKHCLLRPGIEYVAKLIRHLKSLEGAINSTEFGSRLMARTYFLQLMVEFNRFFLGNPVIDSSAFNIDTKVDEVLRYINENLGCNLSIDALSKRFFISKFHFMRRFKEATGFTVHNYVLQKRLSAAAELLESGASAAEAASQSGFSDYSSFHRSFKKMYTLAPRDFAGRRQRSPWHEIQQ